MYKNKKRGDLAFDKIITIVLVITAFMITLAWTHNTFAKANKYTTDFSCQKALEAQAFVARNIPAGETAAETLKPWPGSCKMQEIKIEYEKPENVAKETIKLINRCYTMMGGDNLNPFSRDILYPSEKCFICFSFRAEEMEESAKTTKEQLRSYLTDMKYPGTKITYSEKLHPIIVDDIDNTKFYGVVFTSMRNTLLASYIMEKFGMTDSISNVVIMDLSREEARECLT